MGASVLAAAQTAAPQTDAQMSFLDADSNPIPPDFITLRAADGRVVVPNVQSSSLLFQNVGRKVTLEFSPKGLKQRSIDLVLENAPRVWLSIIADPATGQIKSLEQKPMWPHINREKKLYHLPSHSGISAGGAPANDACGSATPIGNGATPFSTVGATTDGPAHAGQCQFDGQTYEDIWFSYNSTCTGNLEVSTCGTAAYDTDIVVYDGLTCPPTTRLGCNDDTSGCTGFTSRVTVPVVAGNNYLIRIGGFASGDEGTGTVNITCTGTGGGGTNDDCDGADTVVCNSSTAFSNAGNTTDPTDPAYSCRFGSPGQGVGTTWFKFLALGTTAVVNTEGSAVSDTLLAVYSGTCGSLVEIACDDDGGTGLLSALVAGGLTPGNIYYIQVSSFSAASQGNINLNVLCEAEAPPGDLCEEAIPMTCGSSETVDNSAYTTDPTDPIYSCRFGSPGQGVNTVWFTFVATATSAFIDTNNSLAPDTMLAAYSGTCGAFTELACSDDDGVGLLSQFCVQGLTIGQTYYIQASSFSSFDTGEITVTIACPCPAAPTNDECSGAIALGALPTSINFDTTQATDDIGVPCGVASGPWSNLWYSVMGTGGTITLTTCTAGTTHPDTKISVFCGDCNSLTCVTGNDDSCGSGNPFNSTVSFCSQPGVQYLITVGGFAPGQVGVVQLDASSAGSGCNPQVECLPTGACCLTDGSCTVTTAGDCAAQGGTYFGDGSECFSNAVVDGGFEAGAFSGNWVEFSTNFGTPLCDSFCGFGGGTGPHDGSWWAWFGGIPAFEQGSLDQLVTIPTSATTLDFYLEIPVSSGNGVDFMRVLIDGNTVYQADEADGPFVGYQLVSVGIGAFADGGLHTLRFESTQTGDGGAITNFFVDDVSINSSSTECVVPPDCFTLTFETEDDFTTGLVNGQHINTEFGNLVSFSSSGANAGMGIFDSDTGGPNDPSQDIDLLVNSGHILILQTENFPPNGNDVFPRPNDDEDGGSIIMDFTSAATPQSITIIDQDAGDPASSVVLTDGAGKTRTYTLPPNWTGDVTVSGPGIGSLDLTTLAAQPGWGSSATATQQAGFDGENVVRIRVNCGGSMGVDNVYWCQSAQ
jgi:hypothetical protein